MSTLSGHVLDTSRHALPAASVVADGPSRANVLTGADGAYRMDGLAPGAYSIAASAYRFVPSGVTRVQLGQAATVNFGLAATRKRKKKGKKSMAQEHEQAAPTEHTLTHQEAAHLANLGARGVSLVDIIKLGSAIASVFAQASAGAIDQQIRGVHAGGHVWDLEVKGTRRP